MRRSRLMKETVRFLLISFLFGLSGMVGAGSAYGYLYSYLYGVLFFVAGMVAITLALAFWWVVSIIVQWIDSHDENPGLF
jgi:hypothetical protein